MDIPFLDMFFSSVSDTIERKELVILMTPRIIENADNNISFKKNSEDILNEAGFTNK